MEAWYLLLCITGASSLDIDSERHWSQSFTEFRIQAGAVRGEVAEDTPLLLSPLLTAGRVEDARAAARVPPQATLGLESYSGFLTVDPAHDSQMFFWYFPALGAERPREETPWLLWLQGGPGCSGLMGLFNGVGPFYASDDGNLTLNKNSWLVGHSLLFVDSPVGAGFSHTASEEGYTRDVLTVASHLHSLLGQLMQLFPWLRAAPLLLAGESYGGQFVPALAQHVVTHLNTTPINLQGLIIGNGNIEPESHLHFLESFRSAGLVDQAALEEAAPRIEALRRAMQEGRAEETRRIRSGLIAQWLAQAQMSGNMGYNFLTDDWHGFGFLDWLKKPENRRALHVGTAPFEMWNSTVASRLAHDFLRNTRPMLERLLDSYRVLIYCGQLDLMRPCASAADLLRAWRWGGAPAYLAAPYAPYRQDDKLTGYYKSGGNLTWAMIRGAGHMIPGDRPATLQRLLQDWGRGAPSLTPHPPPHPTGGSTNTFQGPEH